jgi:hypothetical protein
MKMRREFLSISLDNIISQNKILCYTAARPQNLQE